ncbi:MAG: hypothetical protein K9I59_08180 [Chlorobium sp.]|jgi:hypothetical protein|uniref:hypothetical protein n=1 Tax=Chlorobium sp. TaxID=1095 RepID=UPI001D1EB852|nr:hypothetical protein [Chlorobium sp.]MBN1279975.1 hypothetical protein [Chlorobiaceae bacterium]MCF8216778.1 hypothetical protein [Chlorobium sp.]MCF8271646.1 hypothetical protein [Chlorobium sp.]MCF8288018.1 hypothetical protein [Chlorobium sp.]MCF8291581.1 hypothetical protein [Chlorobium sp.]
MASGRSNISRSVWRFFEILLFFVISVVGFNVYAKTSTLNSKLKSRTLQENPDNRHAGLLLESSTLFNCSLLHLFPDTHKKRHDCLSGHHIQQTCCNVTNRQAEALLFRSDYPITPVFTAVPRNLLQQNPILLI